MESSKNNVDSIRDIEPREHENLQENQCTWMLDGTVLNDIKEDAVMLHGEFKVNNIKKDTKIKSNKIYHYSSSSLNEKEMFFLNPLYPLYLKGSLSLVILILTIMGLAYMKLFPIEIAVPFAGGLSIFLITFIGEIRSKKYVRSKI